MVYGIVLPILHLSILAQDDPNCQVPANSLVCTDQRGEGAWLGTDDRLQYRNPQEMDET